MKCGIVFLSVLVLLGSHRSYAQNADVAASPSALWDGASGTALVPETVRTFPGRHVRNATLAQNESRYVRTGRLQQEFVALIDGYFDIRLPAGTPMIAQGPPIAIMMQQPGQPARAPPFAGRLQWCALPAQGGFVCFFQDLNGAIRVFPTYRGGRAPSDRASSGPSYPSPAPEIVEVDTGQPPLRRAIILDDFDEAGIALRTRLSEGEASSSYRSGRYAWGEAVAIPVRPNLALRATPVRSESGELIAAEVSFFEERQ